MNLLDAIAWVAVAAGVATVGASVAELRGKRISAKWAAMVWWLPLVLTGGAFLFLASRFLVADLSYEYVFFYTRSDLDWPWRLAGTWAGREGSLLLWATALAAVAGFVHWSHQHKTPRAGQSEEKDDELQLARVWTRLVLGVFLTAFLVAVATQGTFNATSADLLQGRPTGNGLNPTLQSGYILIHPPLMFTAYALATLPAAAAIAHVLSGTNRWSHVALTPSRIGWLLSSAAMGLGALWAYYTLGFGGYWAWDPVEVANLLPWLALTLYLHAQLQHYRYGTYRAAGPLLGVLPFLLTLFSTISTRSGLWVSVHAFTDPTDTFDADGAARLLGILHKEPSLAFHVGLFLATLLVFLALWCRRLAIDNGTWAKPSRIVAAILAACAGWALIDPGSFLSALFATSSTLLAKHVGYGLLLLVFAAFLAAAGPLLAKRDEPRTDTRRGLARIDMRSLAGYSILVLALALMVLFLFHIFAINGWSTAQYEARFPWLATPVLLGLIALQGHTHLGRRRSLQVAAGALGLALLAAFAQPAHRGGAYLATLSSVLVLVSLDRTRRAAFPSGMSRRAKRAATLLWAAALLDLLFWLDPPSRVGFGALSWHPVWPAQLIFGAVSLLALWLATRNLLGHPAKSGFTHLLVGALGGFWIAPILAFVAWLVGRPRGPAAAMDRAARTRLRQVGLFGVHLAMALALLGYAPSTYYKEQATGNVSQAQALQAGGTSLTLAGTSLGPQSLGPVDTVQPVFNVQRVGNLVGTVQGQLHWEAQAAAHYPLPGTLRTWNGDLFVEVEAVHVAPGSVCSGGAADGAWIEAYKGSVPGRVCAGAIIDGARVHAVALPGLGLLWLAMALGVAAMATLLWAEPVLSTPRWPNRTD